MFICFYWLIVTPLGLEPRTLSLKVRCSNQLSYEVINENEGTGKELFRLLSATSRRNMLVTHNDIRGVLIPHTC